LSSSRQLSMALRMWLRLANQGCDRRSLVEQAREAGGAATPMLSTASPTVGGATRRWARTEDYIREVADARVWEGVHYRFSTEVGVAMGRQVGRLVAAKMFVTAR
jgi:hypothetical protein